ncbi:MAG: condensation domain-containing protein, partial [Acidobacteria bacterium]|nr:condensation domain-containing protein [Acidobacteriota bacterium]
MALVQEVKIGDKYICAYYVSKSELDISELREYLSKELPDYMIPSFFMQLEKIPLTPNGKIDRRAFPIPELKVTESYTAPRNKIEKKLVELWAELFSRDALHVSQLQTSIGIEDNFFHLGGHSLKATVLAAMIYKEFNVKIPLNEFFQRSTIREMAIFIKEAEKEEFFAVSPAEEKEYYPLSSAQKRLYFLQQLEPGNITYNMPYIIPLAENIDRDKLEEVFKVLIARHESLRTSFETINMEPFQVIHKKVVFSIPQANKEEENTEEIIASLTSPFDLKLAPLLRVHYLTDAPHRGRPFPRMLFIDMHHIITDGMSQNILAKEFASLCAGDPLVSLTLQYKDYSEWQRSAARQKAIKEQETYWVKEFAGELPVLQLPTDFPRPIEQSSAGNIVMFKLNARETDALNAMIKESDVTLYMALLAMFTILLAKLSGQEDIIIGTPIAARRHPDLQPVVGMFVNTLAMRNNPSGEKTYKHYLQQVKSRTLEAYENQDYPFEELVELLSVTRDIGRNPVFDVLFNLLNKTDRVNDKNLLPGEPGKHRKRTAKFDMNWTVSEINSELRINIEYATKLFKPASIDRFFCYFKNLVHKLSGEIELKIANIEILGDLEKKEILKLSNGERFADDGEQTIPGLFADQAAKTPDYIALHGCMIAWMDDGMDAWMHGEVARDVSLTYHQLNEHSNRLAGLLMEKGVHPDTIVAVKIERSVEMIIGILAILKTGGGYLPIDPEYPQDRIDYMLKDSNAKILIINKSEIRNPKIETNSNDQNKNRDFGIASVLNFEHLDFDIVSNFVLRASNLIPSNLAYVIYTSGSSGKPKGVMLEQHNLINLLKFQFIYTNLNFSRVLQFTTISFDVSFQEIFSALLSGGQLFLIDKEIRTDIPALLRLIEKNDIKTLFLPVSFLKVIFQEEEYLKLIPRCIEHIAAAGEQLVVSNNLKKYLKEQRVYLHNHYGPSETHVVTTLTIDPLGEIGELPSIGKPLMNTGIYIMDKYGKLMPTGSAGEIYIGGAQVGRGYLNRPELTAERFKKHRSYGSY